MTNPGICSALLAFGIYRLTPQVSRVKLNHVMLTPRLIHVCQYYRHKKRFSSRLHVQHGHHWMLWDLAVWACFCQKRLHRMRPKLLVKGWLYFPLIVRVYQFWSFMMCLSFLELVYVPIVFELSKLSGALCPKNVSYNNSIRTNFIIN